MLKRTVTLCCVLLLAGSTWGRSAQEMIDQLNNTTGQKQLEAALRLGNFRFPEVVAALALKLDDKHTDVTVRAACASSLGKINDVSSYAQVEALAKKPQEKGLVRSSCVKAMVAMKGSDVINDLALMMKTEKSRLVRRTIEGALSEMADKQRVAIAVTALLKDETAAPSAIRVLGEVGGPGVIAPLAKQLDSPKASIRQAVIKALGSIHHPDVVPYLINYYPKANDAEKGQILSGLANHPHVEAMRLLVAELTGTKTYPALRRRAALALGNLRAQHTIPVLVKIMLNTAEPTGLRLTCAQALGKFSDRDDQAIAGLIGALADKRIGDTAALSLSRITKRFFGTDKQKWQDWFERHRSRRDRKQRVGH